MLVMKTTYKKLPLLKKGYPTYFWIASLDDHIGRKKSISFRRTRHTVNPSIGLHLDCIPSLTERHHQNTLIWQQSLIASIPRHKTSDVAYMLRYIAAIGKILGAGFLCICVCNFLVMDTKDE